MNKKKIMRKTCNFAKTVVKKTQEIFEISQLKFKIMQVKNKIERKYVKIGYFVYNKQKTDGFKVLKEEIENEKFKNVCKELDQLYAKLRKLELECDEIKRYVKKDENNFLKKCDCEEKKLNKGVNGEFNKFKKEFEEEKTETNEEDLIAREDDFEF